MKANIVAWLDSLPEGTDVVGVVGCIESGAVERWMAEKEAQK